MGKAARCWACSSREPEWSFLGSFLAHHPHVVHPRAVGDILDCSEDFRRRRRAREVTDTKVLSLLIHSARMVVSGQFLGSQPTCRPSSICWWHSRLQWGPPAPPPCPGSDRHQGVELAHPQCQHGRFISGPASNVMFTKNTGRVIYQHRDAKEKKGIFRIFFFWFLT